MKTILLDVPILDVDVTVEAATADRKAMSDPLAGKYQRHYKGEFEAAKKALSPFSGTLAWGVHDYEAFTFVGDGLRLVFYPHKTSAGNRHIRVRDNGSKDKVRFAEAIGRLRVEIGNWCTFTIKGKHQAQYHAADNIQPNWMTQR